MATPPPRSIMPKMGGFSVASVPRPRLPLSRWRRPCRLFCDRIRLPFVPGHDRDFVAFDLTRQRGGELLGENTTASLAGHLMHIISVEIKFLSHVVVREVESHQIQTQDPHPQGLMMPGKDGLRQIVEASAARLALIALPRRLQNMWRR